jgi:class 3 adenylate cyclase
VNEIPPISSHGIPPAPVGAGELPQDPGPASRTELATPPILQHLPKVRVWSRSPHLLHDGAKSYMRYPNSVTFWGVLTLTEQRAFTAVAHRRSYRRGSLLMREGDRLDHVFVILSGRTRIYVRENGTELTLAERGPGELVGERAALELSVRSATVVALEPVEALAVSAEDFQAFLQTHVDIQSIVDGQNYGRLSDGQPVGRSLLNGQNCTIVNTDVVGFSQPIRNDDHRRLVRQANLNMTMAAIDGIFDSCSMEDRGDGLLMVVRPDIPTQQVVECLLNALPSALRKHNGMYSSAVQIQLRIAIDVGPVVSDAAGISGQAIIRTARLLDAAELKGAMAETGANLGIIASAFVYETAIRQTNGPVDPAHYIQVEVNVKESSIPAWMQLIG